MAFSSNNPHKQSLIPSYLYSPSSIRIENGSLISKHKNSVPPPVSSSTVAGEIRNGFVIPSPNEPAGKIKMFSPAYYSACTFGGILSCGLTHTAVTPLDLVKCNMQVKKLLCFFFFSLIRKFKFIY